MVVVVAMYELAIHFVTRLRHRIINEKKIATDWKTAIEKNPKM
jgi:hypothetical protein